MKKIKLHGKRGIGKYILVDNEDFALINQYKWYFNKGYAERIIYVKGSGRDRPKKYMQSVHRLIMDAPKGKSVDHINHDGLDNRRENLRVCSHMQNMNNIRMPKNNTSGYKGVRWHKGAQKWIAEIRCMGTRYYLGLYTNVDDAVNAYKEKATMLRGDYEATE